MLIITQKTQQKNIFLAFGRIRSYDEDERASPVTTGAGDAPPEN